MTTWFPDVIDLMMRDECSVRYKSDQLKNFYNCVSVLLSNQIKEFLRNGIAKWTNLFLPENSDFLPLFKVDLVLDDEGMQFLPRYEQLENSLVSVIDEVASRMQNVQTLQSWMASSFAQNSPPQFVNTQLSEELLNIHKQTVINTVKEKFKHVDEYLKMQFVDKFSYLIDGEAAQSVQKFLNDPEQTFATIEKEAQSFWKTCNEIRILDAIHTVSLFEIGCQDIKRGLCDRAKNFAGINLNKLVDEIRKTNQGICTAYNEIEDVCLKSAKTTEELMEQLSFVENARSIGSLQLTDKIKMTLKHFLVLTDTHLFTSEDVELINSAVTWPTRAAPIFDKHDEVID
ncbi:dynein axonemal heavy chain 12-like [Symsagittifera roscoffensis]|uniref:dynein axonemal heavy chain 12-like n=1 Tax=Symsagittifera roscoffensis TaxID=84072 RepID=UPI00307C2F51